MELTKKIALFVKDEVTEQPDLKYMAIYEDVAKINEDVAIFFAYIHNIINFYASSFNNRVGSKFNAGDSRDYLKVINKLRQFNDLVKNSEFQFYMDRNYKEVLDAAEPYLKAAWGSDLPNDLPKFIIKSYDPILFLQEDSKFRKFNKKSFNLISIGSGAYAQVFKYKDEDYDTVFAYKKLNKNTSEKEVARFKQEYDIMKKCEHPNLLRVYKYFSLENAYNMEYCDYTLEDYISKNNTKIELNVRLSILYQFLDGINYIHSIGLFHRDLSFKNILIKVDKYNYPFVRISDFGLVKDTTKQLTSSDSDMKGTLRDPFLESFKDYNIKSELYAIAYIITFILFGRYSPRKTDFTYSIVEKCVSPNFEERYNSLQELRKDLNIIIKKTTH